MVRRLISLSHAENEQLKHAEPRQGGYDFNWVLNNPSDLYALAVRVTDFYNRDAAQRLPTLFEHPSIAAAKNAIEFGESCQMLEFAAI